MSTLSVRLPESLHKKIKEIAKEEKVSINQFISSAAAEKDLCYYDRRVFKKRG